MADVTVVGNVANAELKFTPQGTPVFEFSVAENHRKKQGDQWVEDGTSWRRVTVWGGDARDGVKDSAEAAAEVVVQGSRVIVVGAERLREFTARDGSQGKSLEVTARHVGVVPSRKGGQSAPAQSSGWGEQSGWGGQQEAPF